MRHTACPCAEIARLFKLNAIVDEVDAEANLVAAIHRCHIVSEGRAAQQATLRPEALRCRAFLFTNVICFEEPGSMLFTKRHTIPLHSLLAVQAEGNAPAAATGDAEGGGAEAEGIDSPQTGTLVTLSLQMEGTSLQITMPSAEGERLASLLEFLRLKALEVDRMHREEEEANRGFDEQSDGGAGGHPGNGRRRPSSVGLENAPQALDAATMEKLRRPSSVGLENAPQALDAATMEKLRRPSSVGLEADPVPATEAAVAAAAVLPPAVALPLAVAPPPAAAAAPAASSASAGGIGSAAAAVHSDGSALQDATEMSDADWDLLLMGARYETYEKGMALIWKGSHPAGLIQVVRGKVRVEVEVPGRPEAMVLGHLGVGDVVGEISFLLGVGASATVVCETDQTSTILLPNDYIVPLFAERPDVATRFYAFLATRQAERLRGIFAQTSAGYTEFVMNATSTAPATVLALTQNRAYLAIFEAWLTAHPKHTDAFGPHIKFAREVFALQKEADSHVVRVAIDRTFRKYLRARAGAQPTPLGALCVGAQTLDDLEAVALGAGSRSLTPLELRHVYDGMLATALEALETHCLRDFLRSRHYEYINEIRSKQTRTPTHDSFRVVRRVGGGAFGQVYEVVKRDCGVRYAMKVMSKEATIGYFGEEYWSAIVMSERDALAVLHHPLLINLAYAFQTIDYLWLVTPPPQPSPSPAPYPHHARHRPSPPCPAPGFRWPVQAPAPVARP